MTRSARTLTAVVGLTALCMGCAGRSDIRPTGEPPASASTAARTPARKPATSSPITKPPRSGDVTSTAQPLNLAALTLRLRNTSALGVFTKISLKNDVDDLLDEFRAYHRHESTTPLPELRRRYDSLLLEVLTQIKSKDPPLAADIASSREAIWAVLSDPKKFATI